MDGDKEDLSQLNDCQSFKATKEFWVKFEKNILSKKAETMRENIKMEALTLRGEHKISIYDTAMLETSSMTEASTQTEDEIRTDEQEDIVRIEIDNEGLSGINGTNKTVWDDCLDLCLINCFDCSIS